MQNPTTAGAVSDSKLQQHTTLGQVGPAERRRRTLFIKPNLAHHQRNRVIELTDFFDRRPSVVDGEIRRSPMYCSSLCAANWRAWAKTISSVWLTCPEVFLREKRGNFILDLLWRQLPRGIVVHFGNLYADSGFRAPCGVKSVLSRFNTTVGPSIPSQWCARPDPVC
jgi:hypothetical protein